MNQETGIRDFERYSDEILKKYKVPGFAIGLAEDGQLCYGKGFGYRDSEAKSPLSADTVFGVGSITKAITATAILQLQEKKMLTVNDCVNKYLPEFKTPNEEQAKQMTIHHFLTHTSGLPPLATLIGAIKRSMEKDPKLGGDQQQENPLDAIQAIDTYAEVMDFIAKAEFTLLGEPGTEFSYSNDAYALLGAIIERVSGKPYEQYVQENILEPAGMHNSGFQYKTLNGYEDIAILYDMREQDGEEIIFRSNNPWDAPAMRAAGFLKSTVNDMLKFTEIIRNAGKVGRTRILSPESVELMTTPHIKCSHGSYYGYGLVIIPDFFGYKLIHHGGDIKGVTAQMNILPELNLTGISLANLAGAPSSKLLFSAFSSLHLNKTIDASHLNVEVVDLDLESLKEFEGTFISGDGMINKFYVENGRLHVAIAGMPDIELNPIGNDQFLLTIREMDSTIRFLRNKDKKIHRVEFVLRQIPKVDEGK
ncbi:CubicO group peptidase, beta-lactamase class C family [Terribacillus halophilus]|uniref:CubicO group peptidase, beta-lactamase class C family n=1 Tax=Terribacillus halophilus TaxID=361279 RepID=A0A1G6UJM1_9BACI|nr:serine hydrolase [Terribacillus halophilus]SDD40916.1 CubicO group peptidase, beta-lactamase class C family [Terribacillus halophilus]